MNFPLTLVRVPAAEASERLQSFVFGGMYGGIRVPRGIDPESVGAYLKTHLSPTASPDAYRNALEAMRFYERADVLPTMNSALMHPLKTAPDVRRAAVAVQAMGELGSGADVAAGTQYCESTLVSHNLATTVVRPLLEASIGLNSTECLSRVAERVREKVQELAAHQNEGPGSRRDYQNLLAVQRNEVPRSESVLRKKLQLHTAPLDARRAAMTALYLRQMPWATPSLEVWAGRALRWEASEIAQLPVHAELARALDEAGTASKPDRDFAIRRAAQAIVYLQGRLTSAQKDLYTQAKPGIFNFLWDDLPDWVVTREELPEKK